MIDANGWLTQATHCPSPNFNSRPTNTDIDLLVIHNISLPPGQFGEGYVQRFFQNALPADGHPYFESIHHLQVSAHCFIERDGNITQFVSFLDRAWHAGLSHFQGRDNCNDFSIGIELEGTDDVPYSDEQYHSLIALTKVLMQQYPRIQQSKIVGHSDIAPNRKTDPGASFDWSRYLMLLEKA